MAACGCTLSRPGTRGVAQFCSSTVFLSPGSPGAAKCFRIWRTTIDSSRWISADTVSPTSRATGYADRRLWADDILAVTRELHMEQPVLCGWSYGPIVILDYIRQYGEDDIGGMCFVDGLTKLGSDEALSVLTPELLSLVPGFFATEVEESVRSLTSLLRMCFVQEPSPEDLYLMLGYNLAVPPYVRQALFSRSFDNDDLLPTIRKPVLVVHGAQDAVVKPCNRRPVQSQHRPRADSGHARRWARAVLGRRGDVQPAPAHILRKPLIIAE